MGMPVMGIWTQHAGEVDGVESRDAARGSRAEDSVAGPEASNAQPEASSARNTQFSALVTRQSGLMFRVAYALLRNPHDAEDAVQEAFLKLYRGDAWLRMENEKAFLARTVWRVALDKRPPKPGTMEDVTEVELEAPGDSPETSASDGQQRDLLRRLMDRLPEDLRQVLLLSSVEAMTSREVGAALGIPEGTVRTRLMRAKTELKQQVEREKARRR